MIRTCKYCNTNYNVSDKAYNSLYCSTKCRYLYRYKEKRIKTCKYCKQAFKPTIKGNSKYCSVDCSKLARKVSRRKERKERLCLLCSKTFTVAGNSTKKFCSKSCNNTYKLRMLKVKILAHYGNRCSCCGEDRYEFLCLDHMAGNGNNHRRYLNIRGGSSFYHWIIKNNYPDGYRILCQNCNHAYGHYGYCPHISNEHYFVRPINNHIRMAVS